ncbi:MAG: 30S ribosomal protein S18 [Candidatus Omnitrophica bacterium]|nr:30S ribosomal protein S18 [Candidatus Omnitrophota bacterium]
MRRAKEKLKRKGPAKKRFFRRKECKFCVEKLPMLDYKEALRLQKYITDKGKIVSSRISGNCAKHQRKLARSIKRARTAALLPFVIG